MWCAVWRSQTSSRRTIALSRRHTLYSLLLPSIRPSTLYVLEQLVRLAMSASMTINESPNKTLNLLRKLRQRPFFIQQSLQLKHHLRLVQQPFNLKLTRQFSCTPTLALEPVRQTNCMLNTLRCTVIHTQFVCSQMLSANHIHNLLHLTTNLPTVCLIGPDHE